MSKADDDEYDRKQLTLQLKKMTARQIRAMDKETITRILGCGLIDASALLEYWMLHASKDAMVDMEESLSIQSSDENGTIITPPWVKTEHKWVEDLCEKGRSEVVRRYQIAPESIHDLEPFYKKARESTEAHVAPLFRGHPEKVKALCDRIDEHLANHDLTHDYKARQVMGWAELVDAERAWETSHIDSSKRFK